MRFGSSLLGSSLALLVACSPSRKEPLPEGGAAPLVLAAQDAASSDAQASAPHFVHDAESFADLRILRYRVRDFDTLTRKQKLLLYYLQEAALSGRDITYDQKYVHNLAVRRTLEAVALGLSDTPSDEESALITYLKRVWFSNGIHHHVSTRKLTPDGLSRETFATLVRGVDPAKLPLQPGESVEALITKLTPVIFDPQVSAQGVSKDEQRDPVADSANHFYVGLTRAEVQSYVTARKAAHDKSAASFGLNSQLVRKKDGGVEERPWRVGGMYDAALRECVRWLEKASEVAENPAQEQALRKLVAFYRSGELRDFDAYNVAWVKDTESAVDLIHGFIETYGDPLNMRGTYEALVQLVDKQATQRIQTLSKHAQWFEDHAPIDAAYKKEEVRGIGARVVQAVVSAGDTAPAMPIGVNLPNAAWIREEHGSKSVTLGNLLEAHHEADKDSGVLEEFAASSREVQRARSHGALAQALLVDMHEVIGHASGKLREGVEEPNIALGHYGSTLEEARADLVALYYLLDPKLIELKLVPSLEVGRAAYDAYLRAGLVQLSRVPLGESLEEAHMRNRQLVVQWVLKEGGPQNVVERVERGGKTYLVVRHYPRLRALFGKLLAELQRIKSEGDLESARDLVESYGVRVDPALHKEVLARWQGLRVAPYAGFLQPELVPVQQGDEIVDVRIEYPSDFAAQQLRYSARYAFLPTYN